MRVPVGSGTRNRNQLKRGGGGRGVGRLSSSEIGARPTVFGARGSAPPPFANAYPPSDASTTATKIALAIGSTVALERRIL